ncbi:hypothetical protein MIND_01165200 [Mycena indigotica]|uniref:Restriction of telomere capping protein 4 n=1 Tax=Mycena indigotica TaxID=2126181 RepID=A0A8H6S3T8_9AGAR|nr:uncharacterized protein MIND_01165200 [Mycena indigotica]KAF7292670.1 hypothetical protein MIND_01165200 [Mycena indigotica]
MAPTTRKMDAGTADESCRRARILAATIQFFTPPTFTIGPMLKLLSSGSNGDLAAKPSHQSFCVCHYDFHHPIPTLYQILWEEYSAATQPVQPAREIGVVEQRSVKPPKRCPVGREIRARRIKSKAFLTTIYTRHRIRTHELHAVMPNLVPPLSRLLSLSLPLLVLRHVERGLAQTISPAWQERILAQQSMTATVLDSKSLKLEMESQRKVEVELVIYWKVGNISLLSRFHSSDIYDQKSIKAARFPVPVPTYPSMRLDNFPHILTMLTLGPSEMFDLHENGKWKIISTSSVFTVETGRAVILKRRPSLDDEWAVIDCPGLDRELELQPVSRQPPHAAVSPRGSPRKRRLDDFSTSDQLPSSPSKVAKTTSESSAGDVARHLVVSGSLATGPTIHERLFSPTPNVTPMQPTLPVPAPPAHARENTIVPPPVTAVASTRTIAHIPVSEWVDGWETIKEYERQRHPIYRFNKNAFPVVFKIPYVKPTVAGYKKRFNEVPQKLVNHYLAMGRVPEASLKSLFAEAQTGISPRTSASLPSSLPPVAPTSPSVSQATASVLPSSRLPAVVQLPEPQATEVATELVFDDGLAGLEPFDESIFQEIVEAPFGRCPVCNLAYELIPSPKLHGMRQQFEQGGISAGDYCQQHREEATILPLGREQDWPETIDYLALYSTSCAVIAEVVQPLLDDPRASPFFENAVLRREHAAEFHGHPGYFGTIGLAQVSKAVNDYFQQDGNDIDGTTCLPLPASTFIHQVVVPEVQVALIMAALHQDYDEAHRTLLLSEDFGRVLHSTTCRQSFPTLSPLSPSLDLPTISFDEPESIVDKPESDAAGNLCSFCDELLPELLSPALQQMLEPLLLASLPFPLPDNPHHRNISFQKRMDFCLRHELERTTFPTAYAENWPFAPDFSSLFSRICALKAILEELVEDIDNSRFFRESCDDHRRLSQTPSMDQELSDTRRAKFGAAYYGEPGYEIVSLAIQAMFPRDAIAH